MTWDRFKEVFFKRYFPASVRDTKADEFLSLTQGTLTVQNYASRYIELYCFASCMISNEYEKAQKFGKGLWKDICRLVGMLQIRDFFVLVEKVVIVETSLREDKVAHDQKRLVPSRLQTGSRQGRWKKRNYGSGNRQGTKPWGPQENRSHERCIKCHKWHDSECQSFGGNCYNCGISGHKA
ncbi:uncharacterized protein LOC131156037 [Malania oleifera]|uniref:uncharacterized protein LOC131156037 n=1 Tax=Malania oleifera TaxID=397392 RepID=UPI0025AE84EE|nr:uncharacterized protein LOC131156037 [Malania oleifera]